MAPRRLSVSAAHRDDDTIVDAVGPDTYPFDEVVRLIADKIGSRARIVHLWPRLAVTLSRLIGFVVRDVVLTRDKAEGLMSNLLVSESPPTGQTRLSDWLDQNAGSVEAKYASELKRHYR